MPAAAPSHHHRASAWLPAFAPASAALLAGLCLALPARAPAEAARDPFATSAKLVYRTSAQFHLGGLPLSLSARSTTDWVVEGEHYRSHLHIDTADFDQLSEGTIGADDVLEPTRYVEKRPFHKSETVQIDWSAGRILFAAGDTRAPVRGAQDRLSLQFELGRQRLRHPERFPAGSPHEVFLIGTHDVDPWTFVDSGEETIETGRGATRAVRYSARRRVGEVEETMDIWLGAEYRWLPIRIRIVDRKGSIIDSVLQSCEIS